MDMLEVRTLFPVYMNIDSGMLMFLENNIELLRFWEVRKSILKINYKIKNKI